jgi:hypothetical protein
MENNINNINYIHSLIKNPNNYVIDIGASKCSINDPVYHFIINNKFKGLCIEGCLDNIDELKNNISNTFDIYSGYITPININDIFNQFNVPIDFDILKIDIDGYDLEVLRKILEKYKPKIIIAEINEKIPPPILFEVKYKENYSWDYSHCFGFSISSGKEVLDKHEYKIISIFELNNILCIHNNVSDFTSIHTNDDIYEIYKKDYINNQTRINILPWNKDVNYWLEINDNLKLYNEILNYFTLNNIRSIFENKNKILDEDFILDIKMANNIDYLFENLGNIEKKIHISWKNKNILDLNYSIVKNGIYNLKYLNPDYEFTISDDNDVDEYIKNNISYDDYLLIQNKHIVEKTDLWRLLKIYNEGGIYMDIDRLCNIPLQNIIKGNVKCIIPIYKDMDFSQDIMISCSKNPFHKRAIELNLERRKIGTTSIVYLGPTTYLHAISEFLLGYQIPREENNIVIFNDIRNIINNSIYLDTYREDPPYNTILYSGNTINFDKCLFYNDQGVSFHPG